MERHPCIPSSEELKTREVPEDQRRGYSEHRFRTAFGISSWFHRLPEQFTFPTRFVQLSMEDLKLLISVYDDPKKDMEKLGDLIAKIDQTLDDWKETGVFVKLDSKSAKDFVRGIDDKELIELVRVEFEQAQKQCENKQIPRNVAHSTFLKACGKRMKCTTGKEICEQLTNSWRVVEDIKATERYMCYGNSYVDFPLHIVIRKWDQQIQDDSEMEFRGFVNNNQLNAVSQYDYLQIYPFVVENRELIQKRIYEFWEQQLQDLLSQSHRSYVCDFYVPKNPNESVKLVELNPFLSSSGPCLFNWSKENSILLNGPFEFRILSDHSQIKEDDLDKLDDLPDVWREHLYKNFNIVPKTTKSKEHADEASESSPKCNLQ
jgi:hypothetical protein